MPFKQHPTDPYKLVYAPREYDLPTKREWIGLTDEQIMQTWEGVIKYAPGEVRLKDFARLIEGTLKEKNT